MVRNSEHVHASVFRKVVWKRWMRRHVRHVRDGRHVHRGRQMPASLRPPVQRKGLRKQRVQRHLWNVRVRAHVRVGAVPSAVRSAVRWQELRSQRMRRIVRKLRQRADL